ncbi:MAG: hypothetical protein JWP31_615 [Aeromicrobium sp.]|nr:hypothetical protein [Aeromicrobium sp.]
MRISRTHRLVAAAVMTTVATATVITFARGDQTPDTRVAALPTPAGPSAPTVGRSTGAVPTLAPKPEATRTSPTREADPGTDRLGVTPDIETSGGAATDRPGAGVGGRPDAAPGPTPAPAPTTEQPQQPSPSQPTPAPSNPPRKNLVDLLLGQ